MFKLIDRFSSGCIPSFARDNGENWTRLEQKIVWRVAGLLQTKQAGLNFLHFTLHRVGWNYSEIVFFSSRKKVY